MSSTLSNEPDARAQALVASYVRAGYAQTEPPVLQPAEPFLDLSGEDIRRRMFLTSDPEGRELCLRPDLTIPVSRDYLASPQAGKPAGFCYLGAVFRHRENAASEFAQAGIESFGRIDKAAADAEMLALGLEATTQYGLAAPDIRIGTTFDASPNVPTSHEWSPKFGSNATRQYGATPLIGLCPVGLTPRASCVLFDNGR